MTVCDQCNQLCNGLGPYCDECRAEHEEMEQEWKEEMEQEWKEEMEQEWKMENLNTEISRLREDLKIATEALEFYAAFATGKNNQPIFDDENSNRARIYEKYKEHSIGELGVKAHEALYKIKYGTGE